MDMRMGHHRTPRRTWLEPVDPTLRDGDHERSSDARSRRYDRAAAIASSRGFGHRAVGQDRRLRSGICAGRRAGTAQSVHQLALLLGLAVVVAPTLPLLTLYVPLRFSQEREARAFRRALADGADDTAFEEFLAQRAVQNLPYHRLRQITTNPWREIRVGNFRALADAELKRVGVRRPDPAPGRPGVPTRAG